MVSGLELARLTLERTKKFGRNWYRISSLMIPSLISSETKRVGFVLLNTGLLLIPFFFLVSG